MDFTLQTYLIYLPFALGTTWMAGSSLFKHGHALLQDVFSESTNCHECEPLVFGWLLLVEFGVYRLAHASRSCDCRCYHDDRSIECKNRCFVIDLGRGPCDYHGRFISLAAPLTCRISVRALPPFVKILDADGFFVFSFLLKK